MMIIAAPPSTASLNEGIFDLLLNTVLLLMPRIPILCRAEEQIGSQQPSCSLRLWTIATIIAAKSDAGCRRS
jgi:hypothetical protein